MTIRPTLIRSYDHEGQVAAFHHDFGCGVIERIHVRQSYNRTHHQLRLVSGEWPDKETLLRWLGAERMCGGGSITIDGDTASASIAGCD